MGFEWIPEERAQFDTALLAALTAALPGATRFDWTEARRRLLITFDDGAVCSLWEPNFFFSYPSFELAYLFNQAAEAIAAQHQAMIDQGVL
jgi:hypothetical protein